MSLLHRSAMVAPALLLLAMPGAGGAGPEAEQRDPAPIVLFDGESLDGWEPTDFYEAGEVEVRDGAIILHASDASGGMTGITSTRDDLPKANYELRYEARRIDGADFFAAATFPVGEAFVTFVNGGWGGSVTGISSIGGADASENETGTSFDFEDGTWYAFRVRVTDGAIRCWIDDELVVDFDRDGQHLGTRIETRPNEPLGFATWETTGALRAITIRTLPPAEVATDRL